MKKVSKSRYLAVGAVVGLLIFFHYLDFLSPLESTAINSLKPIWSKLYLLGSKASNIYNRQADTVNYANELILANIRIKQLTSEKARLQLLEEENSVLRGHLDFSSKHDSKYVLANVIAQDKTTDNSEYSQSIIIDKGRESGLRAGLAAVSAEGMVIGKIEEVKDGISKIRLSTNNQCKMAASIQNSSKTAGITQGNLGLTINMNFIPQSETVRKGDIVVTSGLEDGIPRGLVIGKVAEIRKSSNELWQSASIEPLIDPGDLIIVSIITP